jgi:ligand-binding SRPBCC domain-containing protein
MPIIKLTTEINASIQTCFDTARSIDVHLQSTGKTKEKVIAGRSSGLCELNDEVTFEATHLWVRQKLSSKIVGFNAPYFFADKMTKGAFKSLYHEHHFEERNACTQMHDIFNYESPLWILGNCADFLFLKRYLTNFLLNRNAAIKNIAESVK